MSADARRLPQFDVYGGGPYHELAERLDRLGAGAARAPRRALLLVAAAWGVPLLLSLFEGHAWGALSERPFLLDPSAHARFLVLIAVFTMAERQVDRRLDDVVRHFADAPLIAARSLPEAARRLATALRRRDAALGDALCLILALAVSLSALLALPMHSQASWIVAPAAEGEGMRVTLAGLWAATVSNTLHWFLVLHWLKSLAIWSLLLRGVARLDLRLSATHPDGCGGLAFVGLYPNAFAAHVFALSCVLGAAVWRMLSTGDLAPVTYGTVMGGWLAIVLALFLVPLAAFSAPLARFKRRELEAAASQATDHGRAAERAVLGENLAAPADPAEPEDTVDSGKLYAAARKLATLPFAREALLPLGAAALVPLAIAGASQWPVKEIWALLRKLLLL